MRILHILSLSNANINVTITAYEFTGQADTECLNGGIAFDDYRVDQFEETFLLCNKHKMFDEIQDYHPKSLISSNSSILLIIYQYKLYSSVSVKASVSLTLCRGLGINPCIVQDLRQFSKISNGVHLGYEDAFVTFRDAGGLFLDLSQPCVYLMISSDAILNHYDVIRASPNGIGCSVHMHLRETPEKTQLFYFHIQGFLQASNLHLARVIVIGESEYKSTKRIKKITIDNKTHKNGGYRSYYEKDDKLSYVFSLSADHLFAWTFYAKTPRDNDVISFETTWYRFSDSWLAARIESTMGSVPEVTWQKVALGVPSSGNIRLQNVHRDAMTVLLMDFSPNITAELVLNARTRRSSAPVYSYLVWTSRLRYEFI